MDRPTLRDSVHRYKACGLDGRYRPSAHRNGPPPVSPMKNRPRVVQKNAVRPTMQDRSKFTDHVGG